MIDNRHRVVRELNTVELMPSNVRNDKSFDTFRRLQTMHAVCEIIPARFHYRRKRQINRASPGDDSSSPRSLRY